MVKGLNWEKPMKTGRFLDKGLDAQKTKPHRWRGSFLLGKFRSTAPSHCLVWLDPKYFYGLVQNFDRLRVLSALMESSALDDLDY